MSPGWRLDLHVHSTYSPDGRSSIDEHVARLATLGLDGLALTDHNTTAGHPRLRELQRERPELLLLPGVEVSTAEGHLLVYGVEDAPPERRPVDETIDWCRSHGGVAVLAHPFRWAHGVGREVTVRARVPAIETTNGHDGRRADARAAAVAAQRSLGSTGGSDAHTALDLDRATTRFPEGATAVDDLLQALARGRTVATGRSATTAERIPLAVRSFALRLGRGFRRI